MSPTRIGAKGLDLIRRFEGFALVSYPDPGSHDGNPWTIGYGHASPDIHSGMRWTQRQCDNALAADLCRFEATVRDGIGDKPTTQDQFDSFCSLCFNIGPAAFKSSTLLKMHKAGRTMEAADQFLRWNRNAGKVMQGLTNRRQAERALYLGTDK